MANVVEKIFKLILNFGDSEEKVPKMSKLLQSLNERLKNILKTIEDIGKADGLKKAADVLGVYNLTVEKTEKVKKKLIEVNKDEKIQNAEAAKYIEDLKTKYGNLTFTKREVGTLTKNYMVLQRAEKGSVEETTAKINILNTAWKKMGAEALKNPPGKQVTADLKQMRNDLRQTTMGAGDFSRNIGRYAGSIQSAFAKIGAAWMAVKGIFNFFRGSIKTITDFEQANTNLATVLGKSLNDIQELTDSALELGRTTEYTASQVTKLQMELAKLGFGENAILSMQKPILQFATAVGADLPAAADLAGATLRAFDLDAKDTDEMLATLAVATNKSALSFSYLQTSMSIVSPVARMFGFDVKDTAALLGTLANSGFDASMAATATRNILLHLADANGKLAKALGQPVHTLPELVDGLKTLREKGIDLAATLELTDKRSVAAFNTFLNGADNLSSLRGELENTDGELKRIQEERLNTVEGSVKLLQSAWEGLVLSFSNSKGVFKAIVDGLTSLVSRTSDLIKGGDDLVTQFDRQIDRVTDLESNIRPLTSEYETLRAKTVRNADEQERLKTITQQLAGAYPSAITAVNEYGDAIEINTEKVNKFLDTERARLKYVHTDAIKDLEKEIAKQQGIIEAAQKKIEKGVAYTGSRDFSGRGAFRDLRSDEVEELQRQTAEANQIKEGALAQLKRLNGEELEQMIQTNIIKREEEKKSREAAEKLRRDEAAAAKAASEQAAKNKAVQEAAEVSAKVVEAKRKADEEYAANRKATADAITLYEIEHQETEINKLAEGVDKKIKLNELASVKAQRAAQREYENKIDQLDKQQKAYEDDPAKVAQIEAEKTRLTESYDRKKTDIEQAGAAARTKILRDATAQELEEYKKVPGKAAEAERQITENKRREVEERLKLARKETEDAIELAKNQFNASQDTADARLGKTGRKRNVARVQNEVKLHKDLGQSYVNELNEIIARGDEAIEEHKERYNELIELIAQEQQSAMNLGKGKNADGTRKSFWQQLTEMSDEDLEQIKQQAFDLALQLSDAIFNARQQASQRQLKAEKKAIDAQYKTEAKLLDSKRDKGLISEKKYQEELEKLEAKKAKKEEEAERAAFEREKKLNIQQVIMNTAISVAKTFAEWGWPLGIPFAALAIASGAVQIATISSQKYAQGGLVALGDGVGVVKGRSHAQGGHHIYLDGTPIGEVEGDELLAIVNKHDTARIGALSAANSVHGRRFAQGGLISPNGYMTNHVSGPVSIRQLEATQRAEFSRQQEAQQIAMVDAIREDTRQQIEAINNRIDTLKVVVLAQDVSDVQSDIKKIKVKSSW